MNRTTAVIASGASLTGAIDLHHIRQDGASMTGDGVKLALIQMPSGWDAANITFQVSVDGTTYNDLYDQYGVEYTVVAAASHTILLNLRDFACIRFIKIRSGTGSSAVNQTSSRTLVLSVRPI